MADASVEISTAELREAVGLLLAAIERRFGSTVELGTDEYFGLFSPDMFVPDSLGREICDWRPAPSWSL